VRKILFAAYCLSGFSLSRTRKSREILFFLKWQFGGFSVRREKTPDVVSMKTENTKTNIKKNERKKFFTASQMWKILVNLKAHLKI
jgi:hypothetical protein